MPISFNYIDRKTNEAVGLNSLDEEICEYFNMEVDKDQFCGPFLDMRSFAIGASYNAPQSTITKEVALKAIEEDKAGWNGMMLSFFKEFLIERYEFHAWR